MELKVMTYNICSGRNFEVYDSAGVKLDHFTAQIDLSAAARVINKYSPDIVGLNEVRGKGKNELFNAQAQILGELTNMNYYFGQAIAFDGVNPYGNALLSKYPIVNAKVVEVPDPKVKDEDEYYETRAIIEAEIDINSEVIKVYVTHFGLAKGEQRNAVATAKSIIENETRKTFFMGDLNMKPDNEIIAPLFEILEDSANKLTDEGFTFDSYNPNRKIDYIFAKNGIEVITAEALDEKASDHRPYMITAKI
ncbi:MAG: hypothetical protein GX633_07485 [Clostridiales bacterium]|nr:hypothetical protein [Clostridiales bacterium]